MANKPRRETTYIMWGSKSIGHRETTRTLEPAGTWRSVVKRVPGEGHECGWWSEGKKETINGGVYIRRENMLVFVCGLVCKPLRRLTVPIPI